MRKLLNMTILFVPQHLRRWQRPSNYCGAEWIDYYSAGVGQSRDSDALERANFDAMLKALGGERDDEGLALSLVRVVRETHWAVGWVEWIAIHERATEALQLADGIKSALRQTQFPSNPKTKKKGKT